MQLKIYQENAIDDLLEKAKRLLSLSDSKKLVFKSPTGSGKTIIMAEFLKRLVDDRVIKQSLGFIWTAPRQLHIQSREKLESYFEASRALKCSYFEDLDDRKISENEILFFNWESINKKNNVYVRDNEQEFNLSKVLGRAKEEGREIILIIDEAHHHATSEISQSLIQMIGPKLTVEVSATPVLSGDLSVDVLLDDVKKDGMIKKRVILNEKFDSFIKEGKIKTQKLSGGSEELVIDAAMKKRQELIDAYKKEGVNVNPLVLIQLPDKRTSLEDRIRERVEGILKNKYKISKEKGNNKLAVWLANEKVNIENLEAPDHYAEVLIFKQAIALGWDCPRAQILVLFREWHSPIFSIQTVGRIMRMPEPDKGHYGNEILNLGYVYTNLDNIKIEEDIAKDYITIYTSKRSADYESMDLASYYSERHREKTRLSPRFTELFLSEAKKYKYDVKDKKKGLKKAIDVKDKKISIKLISDIKREDVDALKGVPIIGDKPIKVSGFDLQKLFDYFVRESLMSGGVSFYPDERSVNKIKDAIYKFLGQAFKIQYGEGQDIVLSEENKKHFLFVIEKAKEKYKKETEKRESKLAVRKNWNIPESLSFGGEYKKVKAKKSIMRPFYSDKKWESESAFIDFLENSDKVDWWFKNGDRDATFFAVPYGDGEMKPFYVDFIVKLKDGRIGLFDPHGLHLADSKAKNTGLRKYIRTENKNGKKLFGGIVANTGRSYSGHWVYFDKSSKDFTEHSFDNWKDLIL